MLVIIQIKVLLRISIIFVVIVLFVIFNGLLNITKNSHAFNFIFGPTGRIHYGVYHVLSSELLDDQVEAHVLRAKDTIRHVFEELVDPRGFFAGVRILDDHQELRKFNLTRAVVIDIHNHR